MVGSVEQITQNLAALDQQIEAIGHEFYKTYLSYLTALGQVVRQQLVLSCYHVCTEGYPAAFLKLSLSQREQLQQAIKSLAKQTQEELIAQLQPVGQPLEPQPAEDKVETEQSANPSQNTAEEILELLLSGADTTSQALPSTPLESLVQWQENLEKSIAKQLRSKSHAANRLLQQSEILPKRLPEPILEAAAKTEEADPLVGNPNFLELLVEAGEKPPNPDKAKEMSGSAMPVVAIHLRLAEIEFNDTTLMAWRNKLRELKKRFQALGREYQKKQKERTIAEAQVAWRSTWSNDS